MRLEYQVFDATGELFESSEEGGPVETIVGSGELPLGIDNALAGLEVGAKLDLTLAGEDAFGEIDPDRIETVPRAEFPEADNFTVGESVELQFEGEEGESEEEIPEDPIDPRRAWSEAQPLRVSRAQRLISVQVEIRRMECSGAWPSRGQSSRYCKRRAPSLFQPRIPRPIPTAR